MQRQRNSGFIIGTLLVLAFIAWTLLVTRVDVQPVGLNGTDIGFAAINTRFHELTGKNLRLYDITDKVELLAIAVCAGFGVMGLGQMLRRKSLRKVDSDILLLGVYYVVVIAVYVFFELIPPINYRPILIDGIMESSYPSSTTLLVLSVMPTLSYQVSRRSDHAAVRGLVRVFVILFTAFVVIARLISGVHWLTDIIGAVLLSTGLFTLYRAIVSRGDRKAIPAGRHLYIPEDD